MRRLFSALALLALLTGQVSPAACILAPERDAAATGHAELNGAAGMSAHAGHTANVNDGQHVASAATAAPETGSHGASSTAPLEHEGSCMELMRCHWAAVPGSDMPSLDVRAAAAEPLIHARRAIANPAPALLTPPPKNHS